MICEKCAGGGSVRVDGEFVLCECQRVLLACGHAKWRLAKKCCDCYVAEERERDETEESLRTENRELREQAAAGARLAGQFEKIDALIHKDITDESLDTRKIIATSRHFRNMRDDITALAATKKDTQPKED